MPELAFLSNGFLVAGAAFAGLPILVHLLLRQRARTVEIGSVRFLRSVIRQHTRRRRIRQWLLLALRVLAVLILAALFARPYLNRTHLLGLNREVLWMVDVSASMRTRDSRSGTLLERAWRELNAEFQKLDKNTSLRIAVFDAAEVREIDKDQLDSVPSATDTATDYTAALAWARDVLTSSTRPQRALHIWTDLQQSGLRGRVAGFPNDVELTVHDVGREMMTNVAVDGVRATAVEIRPGRPVTVIARLYNAGALPIDDLPLALELDGPAGRVSATQRVALAGGKRESIAFDLDLQTPGLYRGQVAITLDDDLACDNQHYVAFEVRHPDRVLLVDGQPGRSPYENETYYLEMALRLDVPTEETSPRTYEVERIVWEDGEGFPDLAGFRVVALANLRQLDQVDFRRLREYLAGGGRVLVLAGDQTAPAMVASLHERGLAPGRIDIDATSGRLRVTQWDKRHPLLRPFSDPQHGDLRRLVFRRALRWDQIDPSATVLMHIGDQPLLIEQTIGAGKILWLGTSIDRDWSDWPQDRLYVPLVRQMLAYLTDQLTELRTVQSNIVQRPGEQVGVEQVDELTMVRNLDPRESVLRRISPGVFSSTLGLPTNDGPREVSAEEAALTPRAAQRADEIWPLIMWLLIAVLAAETLLASRVHA